jgi:hypothetical protein
MADIDISIDSATLEMTVDLKAELPCVAADSKVQNDFFAKDTGDTGRVAGPIAGLKAGRTVFNVDPRRYRSK